MPPGSGATPLAAGTDGSYAYSYDPLATTEQTLEIDDASTLKGSVVVIPPGVLPIASSLQIEEGAAPAAGLSTSLGISETPEQASPALIVQTSDPTQIPVKPLTIKLPLNPGLRLEGKVLVVLGLYWTISGTKYGVIPSDKIRQESGKAAFEISYFGQYQLAYLSTLPATLEAPANQGIVAKKDAEKATDVYIVGTKVVPGQSGVSGGGGYLKNDVWVELAPSSGFKSSYPWFISVDKSKVTVSGTVVATGEMTGSEIPGVWVDGVRTNYTVPAGRNRCYEMSHVYGKDGKLYVTASCQATGTFDSSGAVWVDGVLSTLSFQRGTTNFSKDFEGNIYIADRKGYWKNLEGYTAFTGSPNLAQYLAVSGDGKLYVTTQERGGYFLNNVWQSDDTLRNFLSGRWGSVAKVTLTNGVLAIVAGGVTQPICSSPDSMYGNVLAYDEDRNGNRYVLSSCGEGLLINDQPKAIDTVSAMHMTID